LLSAFESSSDRKGLRDLFAGVLRQAHLSVLSKNITRNTNVRRKKLTSGANQIHSNNPALWNRARFAQWAYFVQKIENCSSIKHRWATYFLFNFKIAVVSNIVGLHTFYLILVQFFSQTHLVTLNRAHHGTREHETRVDRWYVCIPKNPLWAYFGGPWNGKMMVYFVAIWNI
jgi:hypothetical protein